MNKLLVILGPTATGKTDLALRQAMLAQGELVSVDSRQVYKKLDIGTGKMPGKEFRIKKQKGFWEIGGIKIWMVDLISFKKQYAVFDYVKAAGRVIEEIKARGKLPILVGGTGLYLKALIEGLPNLAIPTDTKLRRQLQKFSLKQLQDRLQKISPKKWPEMNYSDRSNPRRLVRAIELATTKMSPVSNTLGKTDLLKVGLTAKREILYGRIDQRVLTRINQGLIDEAQRLNRSGLSFKRMKQLGLEYGVLADYLEGKIQSVNELMKILKWRIHGYARRQETWFKKEKNVIWFDITSSDYKERIEKLVIDWYNQK